MAIRESQRNNHVCANYLQLVTKGPHCTATIITGSQMTQLHMSRCLATLLINMVVRLVF